MRRKPVQPQESVSTPIDLNLCELLFGQRDVMRGGGPDLARKKAVVVSLRTVELSRAISQLHDYPMTHQNRRALSLLRLSASKFGTKPGPLQGINYQHQTRQSQACQVSR
jgi:hypothetical protein